MLVNNFFYRTDPYEISMRIVKHWQFRSYYVVNHKQTTTQQFFCPHPHPPPPPHPRQTKNPDNSNVLHMFNNNTYADFRADYEHVLIPSNFTEPSDGPVVKALDF